MGFNYSVLSIFQGFEIFCKFRKAIQPNQILSESMWGPRGSHSYRPPGCSPFQGATLLLGLLAHIIADTCHDQPHNLQLLRKGTGRKYYNPHFTRERTEAHSSQLTCKKSLQQPTPCFCFLYSQQLTYNLLQRTNLGSWSHFTWTPNSRVCVPPE